VTCSSSCRVLRLTPMLKFIGYIYICGCCLDLYFCRGNSVKITISMHMCRNQVENYMHICRGSSLYFLVLETFTLSFYWIFFEKSKWFQNTKPFLYHSFTWCHQLPKRGRLKASRPLIRVLVINDNHCGLTFLLRYKNRLVRWNDEFVGYEKGWLVCHVMERS
jgi:hypothetical protein